MTTSPETVDGEVRADAYAKEAVRMALVNLGAVAAPAGNMPVVLGAGWPGVLLHEAVGHGLEGDFNRRGTSVFSGHMGELVASELCTVVDDGTLQGRRGSLAIDDEGVPGQYNVLIENGVLKGYMQDKLNARLMGVAPTGNGRRESYAHLPMPRMTNTYMLAGQSTPEEIIASVEYGLYAPNFGGGGGHHLRQVRVLHHRSLPDRKGPHHQTGERGDADRLRHRGDAADLDGRQRSGAR